MKKKFLVTYSIGGQIEWESDNEENALQEVKFFIRTSTKDTLDLMMDSAYPLQADEIE